jgi:Domain of unknown function (DUF4041)/Meiotically up-regulated gene 113
VSDDLIFNPPPGWPASPPGWKPPAGWTPDPSWPDPPPGWELWLPAETGSSPPTSPAVPADAETLIPARTEPSNSPSGVEADLRARVAVLEAEIAARGARATGSVDDHDGYVVLDDDRVLQSVGIYRYHHPLESAAAFKERLDELSGRIAESVTAGRAIVASNMFTFDNSLAKGRKMTDDLSKLMLRAYNAEADNSIRSLRVGNVVTAKKRLDASRTSIARLGAMMEMHISDAFHALRVEEIELTADWLMMKQQEKEDAREERERLREERRVQQELNAERERLDKERAHIANALAALQNSGGSDPALEASLAAIDAAIEANDYRAANIRAGYVYVISNRGAFGPGVVKIGLTRRLEPLDRIAELGDASVPFRFDVHALFFSEDAVTLENELHQTFADRTLNKANARKEFFFASPAEVRAVLAEKVGNLVEFAEHAEATEYLQSVGAWPTDIEVPSPRVPQP